jgi:hypothetical protein
MSSEDIMIRRNVNLKNLESFEKYTEGLFHVLKERFPVGELTCKIEDHTTVLFNRKGDANILTIQMDFTSVWHYTDNSHKVLKKSTTDYAYHEVIEWLEKLSEENYVRRVKTYREEIERLEQRLLGK